MRRVDMPRRLPNDAEKERNGEGFLEAQPPSPPSTCLLSTLLTLNSVVMLRMQRRARISLRDAHEVVRIVPPGCVLVLDKY